MSVDSPPGVLVFGMHRSGTSVATRLVNLLGPSTSTDTIGATDWNPSGLWESRSLIGLNDRLLAATGHTWWYPPPDEPHYRDATRGIDRFVDEARDAFRLVHSPPWVWKDPRTSLLVPFWRRVLGDAAGVLVLRNPLDVARSLERRNAISVHMGIALWERYNRLILRHAQDMPMLVVRYDDLLDDTRHCVDGLHAFLGNLGLASHREPEAATGERSVNRALRHSDAGSTGVPAEIAVDCASAFRLYGLLESLLGATDRFGLHHLPPEDDWVARVLREWGPQRSPQWQDPAH